MEQVKVKSWPELTAKIPESNMGGVDPKEKANDQKNKNGYKCHQCGSKDHLKRDCPQVSGNRDPSEAGNIPLERGNGDLTFIHPENQNATAVVNDTTFYLCAHYVCKKTQRKVFFNRRHTTISTVSTLEHTFV